MRKLLVFLMIGSAAASHAIVVPLLAPFPTTAPMMEPFTTIGPGLFFATPVFSTPVLSTAYALAPGSGQIYVGPPPFWQPPALSPPHTMIGMGTDVAFRVFPSMRRFGGWFRNSPNTAGVGATFAKFAFYDSAGNLIGTQGIPLTNTWTWRGFMTVPALYSRVEIYGNIGGGGVEMDNVRIRQT
ncbi:MAG: hypothetical protein ACAH95_06000 [Fimbriimonas sp.]